MKQYVSPEADNVTPPGSARRWPTDFDSDSDAEYDFYPCNAQFSLDTSALVAALDILLTIVPLEGDYDQSDADCHSPSCSSFVSVNGDAD